MVIRESNRLTHHYSKFISLMENMSMATGATSKAFESQGSAIQENEKYLDSIQGRTEVFKVEIQEAFARMISSDAIKRLISAGTTLIQIFGNFKAVIMLATTALLVFKGKAIWAVITDLAALVAGETAASVATVGLSAAFAKLKAAFLSNPLGIIAVTISALVMDIALINQRAKEAKENLKELMSDLRAENTQAMAMDKLAKEMEALSNKTNLTTEEHSRLTEIQKQMAEYFPQLINNFTKEGDAIATNTKRIQEQIDEKKKWLMLENESLAKRAMNSSTKSDLDKNLEKIKEYDWKINNLEKQGIKLDPDKNKVLDFLDIGESNLYDQLKQFYNEKDKLIKKQKELQKTYDDEQSALNIVKQVYADEIKAKAESMGINIEDEAQRKRLVKTLVDEGKSEQFITDGIKILTDRTKDNTQVNLENADSVAKITQNHDALVKTYKEETDKLSDYVKFQGELRESHKLSQSSIEEIIEKYPELLAYIGNESEMRNKLTGLIKGEEDAQRQAYTNILMNSEEFYNAKIRGNAQMQNEINKVLAKFVDVQGNAYEVDLENYKTMEEVKASVSTQLIKNLAGAWASYWNATTQNFTDEFWYGMRYDMEGTQKAHDMVDQIKSVINSLQNITTKGLDLSTIKIDPISTSDTAKDASNKAYEVIKTVEDKIRSLIEKQIETEKKALDDRLKNYEDFIQKKLKALDDEYKAEDYKDQLAQEQKKRAELEAQQQALLLDNSAEARIKKEDIAKQIEEQQKVIDDIIKNHDRETRKDNLNKQLEDERAKIEKMKAELDAKFTPEQIEQMVKNSIISGTLVSVNGELINLRDAYIDFENKFGEGMTLLGQKIKDEFLTKLQQAKDLIQSMGINGIISDTTAAKIVGSHANGGIIDSTGLRMFHGSKSDPELVLNTPQASKVYDLFAFIKNMPKLTIPGVKKYNDVQPITIQTDSFIRVDGNVDDSTIPKLDAIVDKVAEKIVTTMYKRGQSFA